MNKGKGSYSYFATIRKEELERLKLNEREGCLLKFENELFPCLIRKLKSSPKQFMMGFTLPRKLKPKLKQNRGTNHSFNLVKKSINNQTKEEIPNKLNLTSILPDKTVRNYPLHLFDMDKNLLIWIYSKGNKLAILPKQIPFSKSNYDLLEFAGAFFCEGFKSRKQNKHRDRFSFSNADIEQIKWFIRAVENIFKITKDEWNIQILFPENDEESIQKLKEKWSSIGLAKDKIKIIKNQTVKAEFGVCILNIFNSTLAETIHYIFEQCKKEALKNKRNAIKFFRGLSRGDIGVGKNQRMISFSTESKENAIFFKLLCNVINIKTSNIRPDNRGKEGYWHVCICHYDNLTKLIQFDCITHDKRKHRLYSYFINAKKSRPFMYLKAISLGYNTAIKVSEYSNLSTITTRMFLKKYFDIGFLFRKKEYTGKHPIFTYFLTKKGKDLLNFYEDIKKAISF